MCVSLFLEILLLTHFQGLFCSVLLVLSPSRIWSPVINHREHCNHLLVGALQEKCITGIFNFLPTLAHSHCHRVSPCSKSSIDYYQFAEVHISSLDPESPSDVVQVLIALSFSVSQLGASLHTLFHGSCVCTSGCFSLFVHLSKSNS